MRIAKLACGLVSIAFLAVAAPLGAQSFPAKPLRLIVPTGAGSPNDLRARQMAARFPDVVGQPLIVDNRPGGNMFIGAEAAARAPADGYTLFFGNFITHAFNPWLFRQLPYRDQEDFAPVTLVSASSLILAVNPALPARDLRELIALAKAKPGQLNYAIGGRGSAAFLVMEQVKRTTAIDVVAVPYKAIGAELPDLVAGQVSIGFNFWSILMPFANSGKLRVLAVAGAKRLPAAPDVPTFAEAGVPGIECYAWQGIFVPAGTSRAIVAQLHGAFARILHMPDIHEQLIASGSDVGGNSPEEFGAFVRAERAKWGKVIAEAGITPE